MAQKPGLGRGLGALIPAGSTPPAGVESSKAAIEKIRQNPNQPRKEFDDEALQELADSIKELGILQPLVVSAPSPDGSYHLIAGERRLRAARLAGLKEVPIVIRPESGERDKLLLGLVENVQRADLSPLETADAYQHLGDVFEMTHESIAAKVGKSRSAVSNTLRLLNLIDEAQSALRKGLISEGHGRALLGLNLEGAQSTALRAVLARNLSVRETEELVKRLNAEKQPRESRRAPLSAELRSLEERLQQKLSTRVVLTPKRKGGTITLHYFSNEELNHLIDQLLEHN